MDKRKLMITVLATLFPLNLSLAAGDAARTSGDGASAPAEIPLGAAHPRPSLDELEARLQERDRRYLDLKRRAEALGVVLPQTPPWRSSEAMRGPRSGFEPRGPRQRPMPPMERDEARRQAYSREMHERSEGMEGAMMPGAPAWERRWGPQDEMWAKHRAVIEGMSDEERAACHAMQRYHMGHGRAMSGHSGMMPGPGRMGPGYGYGPSPYGPGNFWDPD